MKIALDIMGGDNAPDSNLYAVVDYINNTPKSESGIILVGDESLARKFFSKNNFTSDRVYFEHTTEVIEMNEKKPSRAFKSKPNSSMIKAINLVKEQNAQAVISAGNTGALLSSSLFILGKISNVNRPALASYIPTNRKGVLLCDCGANLNVKPKHLVQFSVMSQSYLTCIHQIDNPSVGLLNIGAEENKGSELVIEGYQMMSEKVKNFIGNVEAREILDGKCDIVITDGFTGNIVLKLTEGWIGHFGTWISETLDKDNSPNESIKNQINKIFSSLDYEEHGFAPFLGVRGIVLKCHGSSTKISITNTLQSAEILCMKNMVDKMEKQINKTYEEEKSSDKKTVKLNE